MGHSAAFCPGCRDLHRPSLPLVVDPQAIRSRTPSPHPDGCGVAGLGPVCSRIHHRQLGVSLSSLRPTRIRIREEHRVLPAVRLLGEDGSGRRVRSGVLSLAAQMGRRGGQTWKVAAGTFGATLLFLVLSLPIAEFIKECTIGQPLIATSIPRC